MFFCNFFSDILCWLVIWFCIMIFCRGFLFWVVDVFFIIVSVSEGFFVNVLVNWCNCFWLVVFSVFRLGLNFICFIFLLLFVMEFNKLKGDVVVFIMIFIKVFNMIFVVLKFGLLRFFVIFMFRLMMLFKFCNKVSFNVIGVLIVCLFFILFFR